MQLTMNTYGPYPIYAYDTYTSINYAVKTQSRTVYKSIE